MSAARNRPGLDNIDRLAVVKIERQQLVAAAGLFEQLHRLRKERERKKKGRHGAGQVAKVRSINRRAASYHFTHGGVITLSLSFCLVAASSSLSFLTKQTSPAPISVPPYYRYNSFFSRLDSHQSMSSLSNSLNDPSIQTPHSSTFTGAGKKLFFSLLLFPYTPSSAERQALFGYED